jgi:acetyl esterase/lipase
MRHVEGSSNSRRVCDRERSREFRRKAGKRALRRGGALAFCLVLAQGLFLGAPSRAFPLSDVDYNRDAEGPRGPYHDSPVNPALNCLDVHLPAGGGTGLPVMVYVHGGGWRNGDKGNTAYKDELFTGAGYVFVSLNYRLSPDPPDLAAANRVMFPDHPRDVAEAIRYVYDNIHLSGGDNQQIYLIGHSAGAHLVALVGTDPSHLGAFGLPADVIKGVCPLDGAQFDIPVNMAANPSDMLYNAFGTPEENDSTGSWAAASPALHAGPGSPPFFLVTQEGKADRVWQNENLIAAMGRDPSRFVVTVDRTHAEINQDLGDPEDLSHITEAVMGFFEYVRTGAACSDGDGDGYGDPASPACTGGGKWDCDDGNPDVSPGRVEDCGNDADDNCDSLVDAADPDCAIPPPAWGAAATAEAATSMPPVSGVATGLTNLASALFLPALTLLLLRGAARRCRAG